MKRRCAAWWAACWLVLAAPASAGDHQGWLAFATQGVISDDGRWLFWFDGHARYRDNASELGVSIIRPGIGWRVNDRLDLWLGVARVTGHRDGPNVEEDRIWQQATFDVGDWWGGRLGGRTRLEQRDRHGEGDTGWRLRQLLSWKRPLQGTQWSLVVANETFIGLNDTAWGQRSGFDQNRAFFGFSLPLTPQLSGSFGYLNNLLNGVLRDQTNHNLAINFSFRF